MGEYIGNWTIAALEEQLHVLKSGLLAYPCTHLEYMLTARDIATVKRVLKRKRRAGLPHLAVD